MAKGQNKHMRATSENKTAFYQDLKYPTDFLLVRKMKKYEYIHQDGRKTTGDLYQLNSDKSKIESILTNVSIFDRLGDKRLIKVTDDFVSHLAELKKEFDNEHSQYK